MRNTRQEIEDAFENQYRGDLPPPAVFTQTGTVGQMEACGARWPEANFDPERMALLALQMSRRFGFACARVPYCITVEAERLGAEVFSGRDDTQPSVRSSPYRTDDLSVPMPPDDLMDPEEFVSGGRCRMVAEVADSIRRGNEDLFVTAGLIDAPGIASQLLGAENAIMGYLLDRDTIIGWSEAMEPYACEYAKLLSQSADNLTVIGSASLDIFTPEMYHELTEPYLKRQIASIGGYSTIHTCGDTREIVGSLVGTGATALSLETSADPEWFIKEVGGRCRMFGAIHPVHTLLMGSPEDVVSQARRSADAGFDIVTPECGVPPLTPDANLQALAHYRDP